MPGRYSQPPAQDQIARTTPLQVVIKRSIFEIEPALWDSVSSACDLFHSHRFFASIESSGVEAAEYWYILCFNDNKAVATAVLSAFDVDLDLLMPQVFRSISRLVRRIYPSFLRIRVLFCGVPISIGKHTISLADDADLTGVYKVIAAEMEKIASIHQINYLCFKEFSRGGGAGPSSLLSAGYFRANSIPAMNMRLRWKSYDHYVRSMRSSCRRLIKTSLRKLGAGDTRALFRSTGEPGGLFPRLVVRPADELVAGRMSALYQIIMTRAKTRLELLNEEFFRQAAVFMNNDLVFICLNDDTGIRGMAMLARNGNSLHFMLTGFDYDTRDRYQTYFNLLNGIIAYGIENGFEYLDLGQTSYQIKQRLGADAELMDFCFKARSHLLHRVLAALKPILFPGTSLAQRRVFRAPDEEAP